MDRGTFVARASAVADSLLDLDRQEANEVLHQALTFNGRRPSERQEELSAVIRSLDSARYTIVDGVPTANVPLMTTALSQLSSILASPAPDQDAAAPQQTEI